MRDQAHDRADSIVVQKIQSIQIQCDFDYLKRGRLFVEWNSCSQSNIIIFTYIFGLIRPIRQWSSQHDVGQMIIGDSVHFRESHTVKISAQCHSDVYCQHFCRILADFETQLCISLPCFLPLTDHIVCGQIIEIVRDLSSVNPHHSSVGKSISDVVWQTHTFNAAAV